MALPALSGVAGPIPTTGARDCCSGSRHRTLSSAKDSRRHDTFVADQMGKKNRPKKSNAEQDAELDEMFDVVAQDEPAAVGYAQLVAEHAAAVKAAELAPAPPFSTDTLTLQKGMSLPQLGAALESFGLDASGCRKDRANRLSEKMREMKAAKVAPPPPPEPEPGQATAAEDDDEEEEEQWEDEDQDELGKPIDILEEFDGDVDDFKLRLLGKLQLPERIKLERVNAVNRKGQTLLHLAVEMEFEAVIPLLLQQGADVNARDKQGKTVTQKAIELDAAAALDVLLTTSKLDTECYDKHGTTILIGALKSAQWDVAQRIIGLGADVLRLDRRKITPLHALCLGAQDLEGALPAQVEALAAELIAKV